MVRNAANTSAAEMIASVFVSVVLKMFAITLTAPSSAVDPVSSCMSGRIMSSPTTSASPTRADPMTARTRRLRVPEDRTASIARN